jgi:hypothetical protein
MSHSVVIDTFIMREDHNTHDLHLHSQGKMMAVPLIGEKVVGGHASGISSIPIITHARASRSPSMSYNSETTAQPALMNIVPLNHSTALLQHIKDLYLKMAALGTIWPILTPTPSSLTQAPETATRATDPPPEVALHTTLLVPSQLQSPNAKM